VIEHLELERAPDDRPRRVEIRAEEDYALRVWDDESGQTWIQLREVDEWTSPRPLNEFVRDVWVGLR
jgi:hypothetical protein